MSTKILAIESSCDETAAAVVIDGREVRSNIISSQIEIHQQYGGVVPEIASRKHIEAISAVVDEALEKADMSLQDVDAIAVTAAPGLIGALLVGVSYAKGLSYAAQKPLIPVHHIHAHIAANYIAHPELKPPFVAMVASGGHSHIVHVKDYTEFKVLGQTRDDAAGEAFDKVARVLGLGYPGGPLIDREAKKGDPKAIPFPRVHLENSLDFSFSGVKTAVINYLHQLDQKGEHPNVPDVCASCQQAVVDILVENCKKACDKVNAHTLVLAGGVAANSCLRNGMEQLCQQTNRRFFCPPLLLCTDNAAMVGSSAFYLFERGITAPLTLNATAQFDISENVDNYPTKMA